MTTHHPNPHGNLLTGQVEAISAEKQAELIRTFDTESNFRKLVGPVGLFVTTIAVVLSSFHIYTAGFGLLVEIKHRAFHLALVLALIFLVFPHKRPPRDAREAVKTWGWSLAFTAFYLYLAWALVDRLTVLGALGGNGWAFVALVGLVAFVSLPFPQFGGTGDRTSWVDWPLAAVAASVSLYFIVFFNDVFIARVGAPIAQDYMMGVGRSCRSSGWRACSTRCWVATCPASSRTAATRSTASSTTSTWAPRASTGSRSASSRPTCSTSCCSASSRR